MGNSKEVTELMDRFKTKLQAAVLLAQQTPFPTTIEAQQIKTKLGQGITNRQKEIVVQVYNQSLEQYQKIKR